MAKGDRENVQSGLDDILGSVIKTDRRNSGRNIEAPSAQGETPLGSTPAVMTSAMTGVMTDVNEIRQYDNKTLTQYDNKTIEPAPELDQASLLERRYEEALALADSPTTTVTLRVPHALNDWLDEYLHGAWPDKIKKQELLIEALQLLYVRRGRPKEEILETELLPIGARTGKTGRGSR